jgi:hypothetical protein
LHCGLQNLNVQGKHSSCNCPERQEDTETSSFATADLRVEVLSVPREFASPWKYVKSIPAAIALLIRVANTEAETTSEFVSALQRNCSYITWRLSLYADIETVLIRHESLLPRMQSEPSISTNSAEKRAYFPECKASRLSVPTVQRREPTSQNAKRTVYQYLQCIPNKQFFHLNHALGV